VPSAANAGAYEPLAEGKVVVETADGQLLPQAWTGGFAMTELKVHAGLLQIDHLTPGSYRLRMRRPFAARLPLEITLRGPRTFEWNVGQEPPTPKPKSPN